VVDGLVEDVCVRERSVGEMISLKVGDSIALRSLRPLPCSTIIRALSISETLSEATSDNRRPGRRRRSAPPCT